jgi:two-component system sensor histidine kinase RegB
MAQGSMTPINQTPGQTPAPRSIYPAASARNMALLVQLRWVAAAGQLIAIWVSVSVLGLRLEIAPLVAVPVLMIVINGITLLLDRGRVGYSHVELLGALTLDMLALAWQIYFSGGTANPFTFLFLMQIVIGAILLPPAGAASWQAWPR